MNLQPLTNFFSSMFNEQPQEYTPKPELVPFKGTSFKIDFNLLGRVMEAKATMGEEYETQQIANQIKNHCVETIEA